MKALVFPTPNTDFSFLQSKLSFFCDQIIRCEYTPVQCVASAVAINQPDLLFIDADAYFDENGKIRSKLSAWDIPTILTSKCSDLAVRAVPDDLCGYLLQPIVHTELEHAIKRAVNKLIKGSKKRDANHYSPVKPSSKSSLRNCEIIGIPTTEGFTFFSPQEIVRCEGYQNCTRIVTKDRTDIISSYNIGVFRKKFEQYNFFSPHKSHVINLVHMVKFHKEGTIVMSDNSHVPIAKRKKSTFMELVNTSR